MSPVLLAATQPQSITDPPPCLRCSFHQMLLLFSPNIPVLILAKAFYFFYFFLLHHPIALVVKMLLCIHKMFTFMMRSQVMFLSDDSSMQIRCKQCCRIEYSTTTGIQYSTLSANSSSRPFLPFGDFALPFCPA